MNVENIRQRILDEHRKHPDLDWAGIAAKKLLTSMYSENGQYVFGKIIEYIKNDAACEIPIERFFNEKKEPITKKEYGKILLEILCEELKEKFITEQVECSHYYVPFGSIEHSQTGSFICTKCNHKI